MRERRLTGMPPRLAFFLLALPWIAHAAWRVWRLERRLPLEQLVARLRSVPRLRPTWLREHPYWLLASLDRLVDLLPPRRYGRCLKRSLLLLDLWGRCGLRPRLHLGVRRQGESAHEAHAWVTVSESGNDPSLATSSEGYPEAFVF